VRAEQSSSTTACTTYRRAGCPRDHPVDSTSLAEHRPEDVPIGHQVDRLLVGGALGLALFRPDGGKLVDESRLVSVVENLALANVGVEPRRVRPHLVFVAEEQDVGEAWRTRKARSASERDARQATGNGRLATGDERIILHIPYVIPTFVRDLGGCTEDSRIERLGQDDALAVPPTLLVHAVQEHLWRLAVPFRVTELSGDDFHVDVLVEEQLGALDLGVGRREDLGGLLGAREGLDHLIDGQGRSVDWKEVLERGEYRRDVTIERRPSFKVAQDDLANERSHTRGVWRE